MDIIRPNFWLQMIVFYKAKLKTALSGLGAFENASIIVNVCTGHNLYSFRELILKYKKFRIKFSKLFIIWL